MATTVYTVEEIILQSGREITLRPNSITVQRKFMKAFREVIKDNENPEAEDFDIFDQDKTFDQMVGLAAICLTKIAPDLADAENREELEDEVDEPTVYKIIEVCGGIKLNDPNLLEAAAAMTSAQTAEVGTN